MVRKSSDVVNFWYNTFMDKGFSQRLFAYREQRGYTREELAKKVGVHGNTIYRWERGLSIPDLEDFKKLCLALQVSADDLLFGEIQDPLRHLSEENQRIILKLIDALKRQEEIACYVPPPEK